MIFTNIFFNMNVITKINNVDSKINNVDSKINNVGSKINNLYNESNKSIIIYSNGEILLDKRTYNINESIKIEVIDSDMNRDSKKIEKIFAYLIIKTQNNYSDIIVGYCSGN